MDDPVPEKPKASSVTDEEKDAVLRDAEQVAARRGSDGPGPDGEKSEGVLKLKAQAEIFLGMLSMVRGMAGVSAPILPEHRDAFKVGYVGLCAKYGDVMGQWGPEIITAGALIGILFDTKIQMYATRRKPASTQGTPELGIRTNGTPDKPGDDSNRSS